MERLKVDGLNIVKTLINLTISICNEKVCLLSKLMLSYQRILNCYTLDGDDSLVHIIYMYVQCVDCCRYISKIKTISKMDVPNRSLMLPFGTF